MAYSNSPAQDYVQSDYTNSARLNINGSAQEQKFMENRETGKQGNRKTGKQ